jgi:hypothetical protein
MDQNQQDENHECLLILGMHRSGGALLAGCLHHLGFNLGQSLTSGHGADGDKAFQNQDIFLAHEILLRDLGCRWDMVGSLPEGWVESRAAAQFENRLIQILEHQFLGQSPWTIRDPRLCRVLPLWLKVLDKLDIKPNLVHVIRHPYEVACSLKQHHAIEMSKGHLLWLMHHRDALEASCRHNQTLLTYDQLLADPVTTLLKIASALGIELPRDPLECSRVLTDFAQPDLKHHHTNGNGNRTSQRVFTQFAWVYEQFRLSQVKALAAASDCADNSKNEVLSDFPLVAALDFAPQAHAARGHATAMFNNLLGVIGRFEQAEHDQDRQRQQRLLAAANVAETLYVQVYFPLPEHDPRGYSEDASHKMLLSPNEWQPVIWDIPRPEDLHTGRLRLALLNTLGTVSVSSIKLVNAVSGDVLWAAEEAAQFAQCTVEGDGLVLPDAKGLALVCTGNDARLCLPMLPDLPDCPVQLKVWIKASQKQTLLERAWAQLNLEKSRLEHRLHQNQALLEEARQKAQALQQKETERLKQDARHHAKIKTLQQSYQASIQDLQEQLSAKEADIQAGEAKQREQGRRHQQKMAALESTLADQNQTITTLEKQHRHQEELSRQYYQALQDTEETHQDRIDTLESQMQQKKAALERLENRLTDQDGIIAQQRSALLDAEKEAVASRQLKQANRQLNAWMQDLQNAFQALAASRRWKFGHASGRMLEVLRFRAPGPTALDQIQGIFGQFAHTPQPGTDPPLQTGYPAFHNGEVLISWMQQLQNDFQALLASHRWRWGNAVVRTAERLLLRPKVLLAPAHMSEVFAQFEDWQQNSLNGRSGEWLSHDEIRQLNTWLKALEQDFRATLACRRWRVGSAMVCVVKGLSFRRQAPLVTDHMHEIFEDYRNQNQYST